jgi:hypothetical protein
MACIFRIVSLRRFAVVVVHVASCTQQVGKAICIFYLMFKTNIVIITSQIALEINNSGLWHIMNKTKGRRGQEFLYVMV